MPSQKTASKEKKEDKEELIKCQVLRAIGLDATPKLIEEAKARSDRKGLNFISEGFTLMVHPNKDVPSEDGKSMIPGEPVFVDLPESAARKLDAAGAVKRAF